MKFTKEEVNKYAEKLLIGLSEEENKNVLDEFEIIDKNINMINKIPDIKKIEPMTHALDDFYISLREDIAKEAISMKDFLFNCDIHTKDEVKIPKVVK